MTQHPNKNVIEIDVSKAYTSAFCEISEIPIFNEFDAFKPYENEPNLPLNLYVVKDFNHPLSNAKPKLSLRQVRARWNEHRRV